MSKPKDWKKHMFRLKQIADQNFGRAEKSEVLTENLLSYEKRVELVKDAFTKTQKKMHEGIQTKGLDPDRRMKKHAEYQVGHAMLEAATMLGPETLLGKMHRLCGSSEHDISSRLLNHELYTEDKVLKPMNEILERDIPAVMRLKKQLNKLTLDYDSIKNRYTSAKKQADTSGNLPAQQEKVEKLREDMEDAELRQEQCRDQFITELYNFMSKEVEYSKILVDLIQSQKEYHRQCLEILERTLPQLQEEIEFHQDAPVYGCGLEDHLRRTSRDIALVLEVCVCALLELGMDEEGLFRIAGSASKIKKLKSAFNAFVVNEDILSEFDIHSIAGVLKLYLREMPEPLMTFGLYQEWMKAAHLPVDQRLQALWVVLDKLPKSNYNNLRYLIKFLARLAENQTENKMTPSNIAIVIGPNLIWPEGDVGPSVLTTSTQSSIVEALIMHADYFFPGEVDFYVTGSSICTPAGCPLSEHPPPVAQSQLPYAMEPSQTGINYEQTVHSNMTQFTPGEPLITINSVPPAASSVLHSPDCMTSSMSSLQLEGDVSGVTSSPRAPRRKNKTAPPPPDRPQGPAPLPPSQQGTDKDGSDSSDTGSLGTFPPLVDKYSSLERHSGMPSNVDKYGSLERPVLSDKPPIAENKPRVPDRPPIIPIAPPQIPDRPGSPKLDRPPSPSKNKTPDRPPSPISKTKTTPDRPHQPPPSIPDRPSLGAPDKSTTYVPDMYGQSVSTFKPPVPPPPSKSEGITSATSGGTSGGPASQAPVTAHKRQGSGGGTRPPRPQPPPPPPPRPRDSNGSLKIEEEIDGSMEKDSKEQTYL